MVKKKVKKAFKFLEDKIPLERSLVEFRKWEVKNSIERQLKGLYFHASQKLVYQNQKKRFKGSREERTEPSIEVFYIENPEWKKAVQWVNKSF